jgi:hypothetical protein
MAAEGEREKKKLPGGNGLGCDVTPFCSSLGSLSRRPSCSQLTTQSHAVAGLIITASLQRCRAVAVRPLVLVLAGSQRWGCVLFGGRISAAVHEYLK